MATKAELTQIILDNTKALQDVKDDQSAITTDLALIRQSQEGHRVLLNDHLHEHKRLIVWTLIFLVATICSLVGTIFALVAK
jgi:hypothetical protein